MLSSGFRFQKLDEKFRSRAPPEPARPTPGRCVPARSSPGRRPRPAGPRDRTARHRSQTAAIEGAVGRSSSASTCWHTRTACAWSAVSSGGFSTVHDSISTSATFVPRQRAADLLADGLLALAAAAAGDRSAANLRSVRRSLPDRRGSRRPKGLAVRGAGARAHRSPRRATRARVRRARAPRWHLVRCAARSCGTTPRARPASPARSPCGWSRPRGSSARWRAPSRGARVPRRSSTSCTPMLEHSSSASPARITLRRSVPRSSTTASAATALPCRPWCRTMPRPYRRPPSMRGSNGSISMRVDRHGVEVRRDQHGVARAARGRLGDHADALPVTDQLRVEARAGAAAPAGATRSGARR